ncbi:phage major capsid protein [Variovorax sp. HW608]|uniref:phage major capsid protein n=1 Tax=Variovorax sp. HW608 TaxID=1034889 RepID=UPI0012FD6503|nr:phage major capsid protein [Variovorax sp. HW608]
MTLSEKIAAMKAALLEKKNALQAVQDKMAALTVDESLSDDEDAAAEELSQSINKLIDDIEKAERHQLTLARNARPASGTNGGASTEDTIASLRGGGGQLATLAAPGVATRGGGIVTRKPNINLFVRSAIAAFESHHTHYPVQEIIQARWPGQQDLLEVSRLITGYRLKGVQNPAMTDVPEWAGALVRETLAAFMDLLQPESVIPRLGLAPLDFGGSAIIKVPYRLPTATGGNDLSGAFRKEGDPIRIGAARMGTKSLRSYSMGVIGTFTMEMLEASLLNFEQAVQRWMVEDTAKVLDTVFLDDRPEVADTRPAGLRYGLDAGDIHASSGVDPAQVQQDLRDAISAMTDALIGRRPVWLMHPNRATGLSTMWNSVGLPAFPSMEANGTLMGYPVISSITVPKDLVFLIDTAEIAFAGGTPRFDYSTEASIVEQDGLPITDGVQSEVETLDAGTPARSLWQTNSGGIRALWNVSWARMRDHSVQVITGAAW